jgi:hypothetical protein
MADVEREHCGTVPAIVKVVLVMVAGTVLLDTFVGPSTPSLVIARVVLAAGLLRGLEVFRQLLRALLIFGIFGSMFMVADPERWPFGIVELTATIVATIALGTTAVRTWCLPQRPPQNRRNDDGRPRLVPSSSRPSR